MDAREQAKLEAELADLFHDPPLDLRQRVSRRVAVELERGRLRRNGWYALAAAAAIVLWANLSWSVSRDQTYELTRREAPQLATDEIMRLVPGISATEAHRQALLLSGPLSWSDARAERRAAAFGLSAGQ